MEPITRKEKYLSAIAEGTGGDTGQSGEKRMNKGILAALILLSLVMMLCIRIGGTV